MDGDTPAFVVRTTVVVGVKILFVDDGTTVVVRATVVILVEVVVGPAGVAVDGKTAVDAVAVDRATDVCTVDLAVVVVATVEPVCAFACGK